MHRLTSPSSQRSSPAPDSSRWKFSVLPAAVALLFQCHFTWNKGVLESSPFHRQSCVCFLQSCLLNTEIENVSKEPSFEQTAQLPMKNCDMLQVLEHQLRAHTFVSLYKMHWPQYLLLPCTQKMCVFIYLCLKCNYIILELLLVHPKCISDT